MCWSGRRAPCIPQPVVTLDSIKVGLVSQPGDAANLLYLIEPQTTAYDRPPFFTIVPDPITVCSPIVMNGGKVTVMPIFTPRLMREMSSAAAQRDWMVTPRSIVCQWQAVMSGTAYRLLARTIRDA